MLRRHVYVDFVFQFEFAMVCMKRDLYVNGTLANIDNKTIEWVQ